MQKLLLPLLLALFLGLPSPFSRLDRSIFKIYGESDEGVYWGTGFCAPGQSSVLITANHIAAEGRLTVIVGSDGQRFTMPKVLLRDDKHDVATLMVDEKPCELSPAEFAPDGAPGDEIWLKGWGGGFPVDVLVKGIISSTAFDDKEAKARIQLAQVNGMLGHSGSPIVRADGKIVGMLVGVYSRGDEINAIVPASVLRKVLRK